ncbi:hypothetical protein CCR75_001799 [Bremia lactucae]|uniref:SAM-dependent MTase RsmB/NOP-type domain-containing protein n=1 Tax=Bremia lactucae TaxID=4779 RepID=A0A976FR43_BRELC|nr:hypothetical protein CCR75_001799 [Bremia lactucae]
MANDVTAWNDETVWESSGFMRFLADHQVDLTDLVNPLTKKTSLRFFRKGAFNFLLLKRLNCNANQETEKRCLQLIAANLIREISQRDPMCSLNTNPRAVAWLPGFYSLPASVPLARVDLYKEGQVYGIDISSGYAVALLNLQPGEHVLDLCCAPGAKLTLMADHLQLHGSVTGVDFSKSRLGACKQLVQKYKLFESHSEVLKWRCRLFYADGKTFSIGPKTETMNLKGVEIILDSQEIESRASKDRLRKRKNKSARAREAKHQTLLEWDSALYDKVLVDAECTHDGSIRHLQRLNTASKWKGYVRDHLNSCEIERILELQSRLIRNGFNLLRPGGTMVYSTCSLSVKQNEEIVSAFLQDEPLATLDPIVADKAVPCQEGRLPGTVRFTPSQNTSGLFIARICKAT